MCAFKLYPIRSQQYKENIRDSVLYVILVLDKYLFVYCELCILTPYMFFILVRAITVLWPIPFIFVLINSQ